MTTTTRTVPAYRTFTTAESGAIYNLHVEQEGYVEVIFQSNTGRAYGFNSNPTFCEDLIDMISYTDLRGESLGRVIAQARKNGDLEAIAEEI
jgi:hypothetical protein